MSNAENVWWFGGLVVWWFGLGDLNSLLFHRQTKPLGLWITRCFFTLVDLVAEHIRLDKTYNPSSGCQSPLLSVIS